MKIAFLPDSGIQRILKAFIRTHLYCSYLALDHFSSANNRTQTLFIKQSFFICLSIFSMTFQSRYKNIEITINPDIPLGQIFLHENISRPPQIFRIVPKSIPHIFTVTIGHNYQSFNIYRYKFGACLIKMSLDCYMNDFHCFLFIVNTTLIDFGAL